MLERISVELTNRCGKACWFCYNSSSASGETAWTADEVVAFAGDCAAQGVKAISLGGGEPLEHPGVFEIFARLRGAIFRSMTTNGLLLDDAVFGELARVRPDKVHVSIHFPDNAGEVARVIDCVHALASRRIRSGVNLLVARSKVEAAKEAADALNRAGIGNERIVYLPMRRQDTPSPAELARVAGGGRFQSMTCLARCAASARFASIGWNKTVAWCSYTEARRALPSLSYDGLKRALFGLGLEFCGGIDDGLTRLPARLSGSP